MPSSLEERCPNEGSRPASMGNEDMAPPGNFLCASATLREDRSTHEPEKRTIGFDSAGRVPIVVRNDALHPQH